MEPISQSSLADQEANGFVALPPKAATESDSDKHLDTPSTYTDEHSQTMPGNIPILSNVTNEPYENAQSEQESSLLVSPESPTNSELPSSLERQHLDHANDNEPEGVTEYGISDQQVEVLEEHERTASSDLAPESTQVPKSTPTDLNDEVAKPVAASQSIEPQEDSIREQNVLEDQSSSTKQQITPEPRRDSSDQLEVPAAEEPEITYAVPPALPSDVVAPPSATGQFQTSNDSIESTSSPISPSASSSTHLNPPLNPAPSRSESQPLTITTSRVWESDKDANECRRCKRRFNFLVRRHHCRRCGQVVCDRCSTHRANMARSQIIQDPSIPSWQQVQLASQPQRICDRCYAEMRPPVSSRSATAPPSQPQRMLGQTGYIRKSSSSQSIMSECPVCGKRLCDISLDKSVQEEHVQTCLNVGSPSVATVRYVSYKLPEQSPLVGQECLICFEEFEPGDTIARLTCLCSYHRPCIREWLEKGKGCPLHFQISMAL